MVSCYRCGTRNGARRVVSEHRGPRLHWLVHRDCYLRLTYYVITVVVASPGIWIFPKLFADVGFVSALGFFQLASSAEPPRARWNSLYLCGNGTRRERDRRRRTKESILRRRGRSRLTKEMVRAEAGRLSKRWTIPAIQGLQVEQEASWWKRDCRRR